MLVNWLPLVMALVFGLIPPRLLINCECRYLPFTDLWTRVLWRRDGQKRRRWWKLPLVWIDPVRGYVVGASLAQAFTPIPQSKLAQAQLPLFALVGALLVVLMVQTKGRPGQNESLSPAGFMAGLMIALMPLQVSLGALVVGGATAVAMHHYAAGYWAAALFTALLGYVFIGVSPSLGAYVLTVSAPAWIAWFRGTSLVTPVRC